MAGFLLSFRGGFHLAHAVQLNRAADDILRLTHRNHLQNEFARPQEDVEEEAPRGKKSALAVVIAIVLVIGLLVVGLLLIPDSNTGFLGNLKRTITAPLTGRTQTQAVAPTASSFTASITSSTAPYQITFNLVTSNNVTDVRVGISVSGRQRENPDDGVIGVGLAHQRHRVKGISVFIHHR